MLAIFAAKIIILNGPSGAGKTTLQKEIQKNFCEPYLKIGIDNFFDSILPDEINLGEKPKGCFTQEDIRYIKFLEQDGKKIIPLYLGPIGQKVIDGMHGAIKAYADAGNNVVVDYIQYDPAWIPKLKKILKGHQVYWIGINIPLETLEEREKKRGTSPVGHARSHYFTVHKNEKGEKIKYDLEVDTGKLSAHQAMCEIKKIVE